MARKKLQKFTELYEMDNVAQFDQEDAKERLANFLNNKNETILELACGKGEYTLALAKKFPNNNFIGIDIQGERLWYGAKKAKEEKLANVFFLRIQIEDLEKYFAKQSIDQIWITFPDPFPKKGQIKKRLTNPRFLEAYKKILKPKGIIHLKTDDKNLFDYSIETIKASKGEIIEQIEDIYSKKHPDLLDIQTYFEKKHLQTKKTINYLKASLY